MRPIAFTLRRLAVRACLARPLLASTHALGARAASAHAVRAFGSSGIHCKSTSSAEAIEAAVGWTDNEDAAEPKIVLEPIEAVTSGFAGQKPITDYDLSAATMRNLERVGITHLFPVQTQSFDVMMNGSDIVGRSKTGSGKTLAFSLPIVEKVIAKGSRASRDPVALILLPTRELAQQVTDEIARIAPQLRTANIVGGVSYTTQERSLRRGVDILVGTPGRIMDMVDKQNLSLEAVEIAVLDEADMMLKFGFQEAVESILGWIPAEQRQCVMWSATFPKWVDAMARKFLKNAVKIDLVGHNDNHVPATVSHKAIHAPGRSRIEMLENVLRYHAKGGQTLVFTETKQEADEIANSLGGGVRALHGDLSQGMRTQTMDGFRNGSVKTLVCTDIAARGLDIANVELVVQYRLPSDKESFVHRAGRTGRAGRSGTNVVFFDRADVDEVKEFEKRYKFQFKHTAPPHVEHVLEAAVGDVSRRLEAIPPTATRLFEKYAEQMYEKQGLSVVTAALALLAGFDTKSLQPMSMLTGRYNMQTVELDGLKTTREAGMLVQPILPAGTRQPDFYQVDGKFVFDIPHNSVDRLREEIENQGLDGVSVSLAVELSRVLVESNSRGQSNNSRFGRNRDNGGYPSRGGRNSGSNFGRNRDNSNRSRDNGARKDWSSSRSDGGFSRNRNSNFDSGFSRGSRNSRRSDSKSSSFGRFSDMKSPRKSW
ncbi:TPA: hypothetical protein N0F65_001520 [Lagenidium giganteum]|uniref:RNA helicase n=1 Tax=Lagenidium giganteum TaxID=4803 RepID=A0AAV2Z3X6_9STRA|nr:TPA: hypothetical protein N0F65_001520 [Lagenidium giganteum]